MQGNAAYHLGRMLMNLLGKKSLGSWRNRGVSTIATATDEPGLLHPARPNSSQDTDADAKPRVIHAPQPAVPFWK